MFKEWDYTLTPSTIYEVEFNFTETFQTTKDSTYKASPTKKDHALEWVELVEDSPNKLVLQQEKINLIATGTTGGKAEEAGFKVIRMLSGPLGGDAQIAGRVAEGKTQMVFFFKETPRYPDLFVLYAPALRRF